MNSTGRRAHRGSDGGGGEGLRPGGRGGIGGGASAADGVEGASLGRTGGGCGGCFGLVLASGTLAERSPICGGEVQGGAEITIFFLELCDALLEGLLEKEREREKMIETRRDTDIEMSGTAGPEGPLDVSSTVRGQVVVALSASFRRHGGDGRESGCGGINGQGAELRAMLYTRRDP